MFNDEQLALLREISEVATNRSMSLYLVGGVVRDVLLQESLHDRDIDLLVDGDAPSLADALAARVGGTVKRFDTFLTAKLQHLARYPMVEEVDLATARTERYPSPGKLPVVQRATFAEDLKRRDFTVNALAIPLTSFLRAPEIVRDPSLARGAVVDLYGGLADLDARRIRFLHTGSFRDDPTRIFRAARYAVRLGGALEETTLAELRHAVQDGALETISTFRVLSELKHICDERRFDLVLSMLDDLGVLRAAPAFTSVDTARVVEGMKGVYEVLTPGVTRAAVYTALMAVLFSADAPTDRDARWKRMGLSKEALTSIRSAAGEGSEAASHHASSIEGLLVGAALHPARRSEIRSLLSGRER